MRNYPDDVSPNHPNFTGEDEAELCSECDTILDDGEGYDGLCGNCADKAEALTPAEEIAAERLGILTVADDGAPFTCYNHSASGASRGLLRRLCHAQDQDDQDHREAGPRA